MSRALSDESNTHFLTSEGGTECFGGCQLDTTSAVAYDGVGQNVSAPVNEVQYPNLTKGGGICSQGQAISAAAKPMQL